MKIKSPISQTYLSWINNNNNNRKEGFTEKQNQLSAGKNGLVPCPELCIKSYLISQTMQGPRLLLLLLPTGCFDSSTEQRERHMWPKSGFTSAHIPAAWVNSRGCDREHIRCLVNASSAPGLLLPSPEVSLTHSVFKEMLLLSPTPLIKPPWWAGPQPTSAAFLVTQSITVGPCLPNPTRGLGKDRKPPQRPTKQTQKGLTRSAGCQPHPGVWNKHWQVFIYCQSASKYLFLCVTGAHTHSWMMDAFDPSKPGHTFIC